MGACTPSDPKISNVLVCSKLNILSLTKLIGKNINIYDIVQVEYENTFHDKSNNIFFGIINISIFYKYNQT